MMALPFRAWYYFRVGYATYFGMILGISNAIILLYYVAGKEIGILYQIFPTFSDFIITVVIIGIPFLVFIGYTHFKKSMAFSEEAKVVTVANPFNVVIIPNSKEVLAIKFNLFQLDIYESLIANKTNPDDNDEINLELIKVWKSKFKKLLGGKDVRAFLD